MDKSRGQASGHGRKNKRRDMGRAEWARKKTDKRQRNADQPELKRRRIEKGEAELPVYATQFSKEDIDAEGRRPKRKVAVMMGYSGSGYKGMQLTHDQKTIEGDLFKAFVAAGAISKANADDPKKSSFVRCARTDKGVHAAGNVISLKLIIEDEDIVQKINDNLSPQIRVWGLERTTSSFSAYQLCDSRIYEYLIPTYSFLPPHPNSFLGQKIVAFAEEKGDLDNLKDRQKEVEGFWEAVDEEAIKPILEQHDDRTRELLYKALYPREGDLEDNDLDDPLASKGSTKDLGDAAETEAHATAEIGTEKLTDETSSIQARRSDSRFLSEILKSLRNAYIAAKRAYRISPERLKRVTDTFELYTGTRQFHNYTIGKHPRDPSASRFIKSFVVNPTPIIINGTEWLSLKVHGQSFMMHQIRKMVGMAALIVRCGCDPQRIVESYGMERLSIPKAPGLGLLLERPVFDTYNKKSKTEYSREPIGFEKYETEMLEFKQREIYERIYREEEKDNIFSHFFNQIDDFSSEAFLFLTSGGIKATEKPLTESKGRKGPAENAILEVTGLDSEEEEQALESNSKDMEG